MTGLYDLWLCSFRIGVPEDDHVDGKGHDDDDGDDFGVTHPSSHLRVGWLEARGAAGP